MRFEEIKAIALVEERADQIRKDALQEARMIINAAEQQAQQLRTDILREAAAANSSAIEKAQQEGQLDATAVAAQGSTNISAMNAAAEEKMDQAIALIVERIVKG